jgi:hypothetical protein
MTRIAATTITCLMLAVPGAAFAAAPQDYRSPDARSVSVTQDYRSPDSRPVPVTQDFTSPDATPTGVGRFVPHAPSNTTSAPGFDWGFLAVGVALMLVVLAGIAYANRRRRTLTAA